LRRLNSEILLGAALAKREGTEHERQPELQHPRSLCREPRWHQPQRLGWTISTASDRLGA
jgi:hypothetical protein